MIYPCESRAKPTVKAFPLPSPFSSHTAPPTTNHRPTNKSPHAVLWQSSSHVRQWKNTSLQRTIFLQVSECDYHRFLHTRQIDFCPVIIKQLHAVQIIKKSKTYLKNDMSQSVSLWQRQASGEGPGGVVTGWGGGGGRAATNLINEVEGKARCTNMVIFPGESAIVSSIR